MNDTTTLTVVSTGGISALQTSVTVDGQPITLNISGQAILPGDQMGRHDVVITTSDGAQTESFSLFYAVADASDITAPIVNINSPDDLSEVTAPTSIIGTVQDDNLIDVLLAYKRTDQTEFTILYRGVDAFNNQAIAEFDPTVLVNGSYHILLQATDVNNLTTGSFNTIHVTGDLKVGNFTITLEDLTIPLAGIPISVSRSYDSRRRSEDLDFGYGWTIDYQNVRLEESVEPTQGWNQYLSDRETFQVAGGYVTTRAICVVPSFDKSVTVTLPNGDVERFTPSIRPVSGTEPAVSNPNCYQVSNRFYNLTFNPSGDTKSTLTSPDGLSLYLSELDNGNLVFVGETEPALVTRYTLTTRTDYVYTLNQDFGVEIITDPNGNSVTFSTSGIVHTSGAEILFNRDTTGRIASISDPAGNLINYNYDAAGDLVSVTDRTLATSTYAYNNSHGLLDMFDPLGRRLLRNIYSDDGRLIAQEDSDGNRTEFNHNLVGRQSIVTDRNGNATVFYYDEHGNVLSQVDALGNTTTFTFDANDNQLSETNALNQTSTATYNEDDDQLTQTDALGNVVSFAYNDRGQETIITDARGNTFNNVYDTKGNLLSITDPVGNVASNVINVHGLVVSTTDVLGNTTSYTYDINNQKQTETDAVGNTTSFTYDTNNNVLTETRTRTLADNSVVTETTTFTYDSDDRLTASIDALGNRSETEYDLLGQVTASIDALGRRTETDYDAYGRVIEVRYPDGTQENNSYEAEGNLLTNTDRLGRVMRYEYDVLNRLIKTTYADGSIAQTEYDAAGRVVAEIDARNNRSEHEYDAAGRRTLSRDALGNETRFVYDADGNLITQTDARGNITTFTYNALDQKTHTTFANSSTQQESVDAFGRVISKTDQAGIVTQYAYDALGRLTQVALDSPLPPGEGIVTSYSYDEAGNKLSQTDANGNTTRWEYDALGRVNARVLPLGQRETMVYDAVGNLSSKTDFNGNTTSYTYDLNHRVTRIDYADGSAETYQYNANSNRTRTEQIAADFSSRVTTWQYDNRDRVIREEQANGAVLEYGYDASGNKTQLIKTVQTGSGPVTTTETYGYDALNRLTQVSVDFPLLPGEGVITTYTYDANGNRSSMSYANGNTTSYSYDVLNRLSDVTISDGATTVLQQYTYTLHSTGRRTQIDELSGRSTSYTYDNLYRVTSETVTDADNGNYTAAYQYDDVGNRTQSIIDGVTTQYTYDNNDRLSQQGGTTYSYDNNGNTLTETLDSNTKAYSYDQRNHLIEVDAAGTSTRYQYNIDGIRTQKVEGSNTSDYLVDQNRDYAQVLSEVSNGNIAVAYTYGDDLISQDRSTNISYYLYDGLGSTRSLSNAAGSLTDSYHYDAFGIELARTGATENDYLYTGEQFDASLSQYYLRARYYNQGIGRFTQMDTFAGVANDPVTLHKYLYAGNDPVLMVDPSGNSFSMGGMMAAMNTMATLANIAVTTIDVFQIATGEKEFSALEFGTSILLNRLPVKYAKMLLKKVAAKTGKVLQIVCMDNSFTEGTLVHTKRGLIPIEEVLIGDYVLSFDEETGENEYQEVVHLIQGENDYELTGIQLDNGEIIEATIKHPFYVDSVWKDADDLAIQDKLFSLNEYSVIEKISMTKRETFVYNLTVDNTHTYYVGVEGVLVHNAKRDCIKKVSGMGQFFKTQFGVGIKKFSRKTSRNVQGQSLYKVSKKSGPLKKGDYYYLDNRHKDHLEVFDKNGDFLRVLNLDGTENAAKTAAAFGRSIKDIIK